MPAVNCSCCGIHITSELGDTCDGCRNDPANGTKKCDPATTWHCFTNYCDGSGCTYKGECQPVESMMAIHRTMPDVIFPVPAFSPLDRSMQIHVHKLGGGNPDKRYAGTWIIELYDAGELRYSAAGMQTLIPRSFYEISGLFAEYLASLEEFSAHADRLTAYASDTSKRRE